MYTEHVDNVLDLHQVQELGTGETAALIFALAEQAGLGLREQARLAEVLGIRVGPHGLKLPDVLTAKEAKRAVERAWKKIRASASP